MTRRVAVVTGAASGIGAAVVDRVLRDGWSCVAVDVDGDPIERRAAADPERVVAVAGDVAVRTTHDRAAERAVELGRLCGWVNNAAVDLPGSAHDLDEARLRRTVDVDLLGVAFGTAAAVRSMVRSGGGSIVNVSSLQARAAWPASFAYEAAKGGVDSLTRQVAVEYGHVGIRANSVQPGAVDTPMTRRSAAEADDPEAELAQYGRLHPIGRIARASEVAAVIAFLLSDDASFVSGVALPVDAGAHARCEIVPSPPIDLS